MLQDSTWQVWETGSMEEAGMHNQKLQCGIVILNYNDFETTSQLLEQIRDYEAFNDIVVVDNHSTDGSYYRLLRYESEKIKIIQAPENGGYSKGNNIGIRYLLNDTEDDIICISNSDVEFDEKFVKRILWQFEKRPSYAILTGLQVTPQGEIAGHPFWKEYPAAEWICSELAALLSIHFFKKKENKDLYVTNKLNSGRTFFQTGAVEGSLFFIRTDDLVKAGLLDEGVWIYYEEDILSKKMEKAGKKIGVDSAVKYIHYGSKTTDKVFSNMTKINHRFRSSIYFFNHYQSDNLVLQTLNYVIRCMIWVKETISMYLQKRRIVNFSGK